jgi:hypothetical protein
MLFHVLASLVGCNQRTSEARVAAGNASKRPNVKLSHASGVSALQQIVLRQGPSRWTPWPGTEASQRPINDFGSVVIGVLCAVVGGVLWWLAARQFETTDDAFIDARTVSISSQVSGAILELNVTDNQVVGPAR